MNMTFKRYFIGALGGLAAFSLAAADHSTHGTDSRHDQEGKQLDAKSFVQKAAQGNMAEIKMAELGIRRAQNDQLKDFARQLHRDHLQASNKLHTVAQQLGVTPEKELKGKHQQELKKLESASNFDREFTLAALKDHAHDVALYEKAQSHIRDAQVKQYAEQTLPTLRQHLEKTRTLAQAVGIDQATIASTLNQAEQPMGGSSGEDVDDEKGRDEGADSKAHQGAGAEQLTEGPQSK